MPRSRSHRRGAVVAFALLSTIGGLTGVPGWGVSEVQALSCRWRVISSYPSMNWINAIYYCDGVPWCGYQGPASVFAGQCDSVYVEPR
jgi:hypothetical protein